MSQKILDLKTFFNLKNGFVHIVLNNEVLFENPENPYIKMRQDFLDKYWIFAADDKLFPIELNTEIKYGDSIVDLETIHKFILQTKEKWILKHKNKRNFPDIVIMNHKLGSSVIIDKKLDKNHTIILDPEVFNCFEDLKFTVGHELGHLDLIETYKIKPFFNLDKTQLVFLLITLISGIGLAMEFSGILKVMFTLAFILAECLFFYIVLSYWSYQARIKNYHNEFYCDSYSAYFIGKVSVDKITFGNHQNAFTHPASELRKLFYAQFNEADFYSWKSPTETHTHYFKYLSVRELIIETNSILSLMKN